MYDRYGMYGKDSQQVCVWYAPNMANIANVDDVYDMECKGMWQRQPMYEMEVCFYRMALMAYEGYMPLCMCNATYTFVAARKVFTLTYSEGGKW